MSSVTHWSWGCSTRCGLTLAGVVQVPLVAALSEEAEDHMKSATAWSLGQIGRHTPDHAKALADTGVLPVLVALENDTHSSEDLKSKCRKALKAIVAKLTFMPALDAMVHRYTI